LKLTPEVRSVVTSTREQGLKTTIEWEEFIMQAQLAWRSEEGTRGGDQRRIKRGRCLQRFHGLSSRRARSLQVR
jgi:hypothetical protein